MCTVDAEISFLASKVDEKRKRRKLSSVFVCVLRMSWMMQRSQEQIEPPSERASEPANDSVS